MGVATIVELEKPIKGLKDRMAGKGLARCDLYLDAIARRLHLRPLDDFISFDPELAAELMGDMKDERGAAIEIPAEQWFPAADGLKTIRGLLAHFDKNPAALAELEPEREKGEGWPQAALGDLKEAERILTRAQKHKVRFHLGCLF